eukprot:scaffold6491_cov49-Cylindrotheca_fusiformis.AAC.1
MAVEAFAVEAEKEAMEEEKGRGQGGREGMISTDDTMAFGAHQESGIFIAEQKFPMMMFHGGTYGSTGQLSQYGAYA